MGEFSIWHWMVVGLVVLLLFGGGKVSSLMGDLASGIKAFKKNMADEPEGAADSATAKSPEPISGPDAEPSPLHATVRETTAAH